MIKKTHRKTEAPAHISAAAAPGISRALAEDLASRFVRPYLTPGADRDRLFHQQGAYEVVQYVLLNGGHRDLMT